MNHTLMAVGWDHPTPTAMLASAQSQAALSFNGNLLKPRARRLSTITPQGLVHRATSLRSSTHFSRTYLRQSVPKPKVRSGIRAAGDMNQTLTDATIASLPPVGERLSKRPDTSTKGRKHTALSQVWEKLGRNAIIIAAVAMLGTHVCVIPASHAVDALKTCACLLKECRVELARCIADPACAANVACLQTCNNRPDETECQIGCGDLFENKVVDQFNDCAVSKKKCVPQRVDQDGFPVPPPMAIVNNFNTLDFSGKWYISSGLNPTFDTFDCQLHEFSASQYKLTGKLSWRINTPDGGFFTRSAVQNFVQDPNQSGVLYNHDNAFLHYQDDWYILSAKTDQQPDDYIFVYYRGRNDAWDGYGGAVVYTRSKTLPESIIPELSAAAKRAGLDFKKFRATDNTCGPELPLFARIEKKVEEGEQAFVQEVKEIGEEVVKVEKTEMNLLDKLRRGVQELRRDEEYFLRELGDEEKALLGDLKMEAEEVEKLFGKALPLRKLR